MDTEQFEKLVVALFGPDGQEAARRLIAGGYREFVRQVVDEVEASLQSEALFGRGNRRWRVVPAQDNIAFLREEERGGRWVPTVESFRVPRPQGNSKVS